MLCAGSSFAQVKECDKCNIRYVTYINNHFEQLDEVNVERFLCSLDFSCNMNPRFVDLATKTLYAILKKNASLVVSVMSKYNHINNKYIYDLLKKSSGSYDFEELQSKIEAIQDSTPVKKQLINCVKVAARSKEK